MSNSNLAVCALRVLEEVSPDIQCRRRLPWYTISSMDSTAFFERAACIWLVQVRTVFAPAMTKQAKSKTHSGWVKAPERSTLALCKRLAERTSKPAGAVVDFTSTIVLSTLGFTSCSSLGREELM